MPASGASSSVGKSSEVDERLRAALQEMDDIMKVSFDGYISPDELCVAKVKTCCQDLYLSLKQCTNERKALESLTQEQIKFLRAWLNTSDRTTNGQSAASLPPGQVHHNEYSAYPDDTGYSSSNHSSTSEQESDNLKHQVMTLQMQMTESRRKFKDLEGRLTNTNDKLIKAEERLHKEQVNKTYMEAHKLDLMAEVAELRKRLQTAENELADYRERYESIQHQVLDLHEKLIARDREITELKTYVSTQNNKNHMVNGNGHYDHHQGQEYFGSLDREALRHRRQSNEVEVLKKTINDLIKSGQEKDRKISELRKAVSTYQRVEEIILQSHRPRSSDSESTSSVNERTTVVSGKPSIEQTVIAAGEHKSGHPTATSTPVAENGKSAAYQNVLNQFSTIASTPTSGNMGSKEIKRSNSFDAAKFNKIIVPEPEKPKSKTPAPVRKALNQPPTTNNLPETDSEEDDEFPAKDDHKKKRGLRKFFSKLKKSSSQEALDQIGATSGAGGAVNGGFKRGGTRATAGPRLGWNSGQSRVPGGVRTDQADGHNREPFNQWSSEQVIHWLNEMGLNMYTSEYKKWNKNGKQLLEATQHEIDKEMRICNPLHRKKIHLALEAERSGSTKDKLLYNQRPEWVSKWLDDIGLPQYKDQFYEARIDSRMLNFITVEDLLYMKISNALHHASIRRGIEILRKINFDLSSLKRRPASVNFNEIHTNTQPSTDQDVVLWTNHRVMEWLRSIDLSEYVANLRGSGVHGALIMLEPKFTVEHLATILNIPPAKTLLRRHLTAHFVNLVGKETQDLKTEAENGIKLEINMKVKHKKNPFKKGKSMTSDYLCPMDLEPIDARAEDKRIREAVALYKKELSKNTNNDTN